MTKILVTGSSGQVGSRLSRILSESGYDVVGIGTRQLAPEEFKYQKYLQADLLKDDIETLIRDVRPNILIHLAWETAPNSFWESLKNSSWLARSIELASAFSKWGGEKIVVAGTSAEYDWVSSAPFSETSPEHPDSTYGRAKLGLLDYLREQSTPFLWTRTFFQFGGKESPGRLIPSLIDSLWAGSEFTIRKPEDIRDFIYIRDVVEIMATLITAEQEGIFNVASGVGTSARDIGLQVASTLGRPELLKFDEQSEEPSIVLADTEKLKETLGGFSFTSLEDAIGETTRDRTAE